MDAAVPVDAKNARPPGTWKTVENAVSHSAHTHYCFRERMIENGESTSVAKPSTESDQAHSFGPMSSEPPFTLNNARVLRPVVGSRPSSSAEPLLGVDRAAWAAMRGPRGPGLPFSVQTAC